jgi:NAD(P) transhydrogenase subunit alpha
VSRDCPNLSVCFPRSSCSLFQVDVIITTANIPGKPAPRLITKDTARLMRAGSVIVDLAAENGGNCELTKPNQVYMDDASGVWICGVCNFPSLMADQASTLFANNLKNLLLEIGGANNTIIDRTNDILGPATVIANGGIVYGLAAHSMPSPAMSPPAPTHAVQHPVTVHSPTRSDRTPKNAAGAGASSVPAPASSSAKSEKAPLLGNGNRNYGASASSSSSGGEVRVDVESGSEGSSGGETMNWLSLILQVILLTALFVGLGVGTPQAFHLQFLVFVLSVVVGYNLVWSVTPALHTPLMSVTNAISGIIILGLMLQVGNSIKNLSVILALVGIGFTSSKKYETKEMRNNSASCDEPVLIVFSLCLFRFLPSTVNIFGGFIVTQKMLAMFTK